MSRWIHLLVAAVSATVLCACDGDRTELEHELAELTRDTGGRIDPLPQMSAYTPPRYESRELVDPFSRQRLAEGNRVQSAAAAVGAALFAAQSNRPRQPLEAWPIEALRMVGTVELRGQANALIRADQSLFRVRVGDYLGQNMGQVTAIAADELSVKELVQDGNGGWVERMATMSLQEEGMRK